MKSRMFILALLTVTLLIGSVNAEILIDENGISGTDDIHAEGNNIIFTEGFTNETITVTKSGIILDGRGYINNNVTLKLVNSTITVIDLTITDAATAIEITGGNVTLSANNIAGNSHGITITNILSDTLVETIVNATSNNFYNDVDLYVNFLKLANMPEATANFTGNYWGYNTKNLTVYPINMDYNDTAPLLEQYGTPPIVVPEFTFIALTIAVSTISCIVLASKKLLEVKT